MHVPISNVSFGTDNRPQHFQSHEQGGVLHVFLHGAFPSCHLYDGLWYFSQGLRNFHGINWVPLPRRTRLSSPGLHGMRKPETIAAVVRTVLLWSALGRSLFLYSWDDWFCY